MNISATINLILTVIALTLFYSNGIVKKKGFVYIIINLALSFNLGTNIGILIF